MGWELLIQFLIKFVDLLTFYGLVKWLYWVCRVKEALNGVLVDQDLGCILLFVVSCKEKQQWREFFVESAQDKFALLSNNHVFNGRLAFQFKDVE